MMNTIQVDQAADRYAGHQILGPATQLLARLRDAVDSCSDGWCYWRAPAHAADQLMTMIEHPEVSTLEVFKLAVSPIKALVTRCASGKYGLYDRDRQCLLSLDVDLFVRMAQAETAPALLGLEARPRAVMAVVTLGLFD